ncbi:auxin-responsive protein IAA33-like [Magnolia sinica]|uniref:auxin-responsive protein IAA33-like n=1 Tax=Magnolia sinica TaxID=86752 RepID=UPI00265ACEEE|nr:auxin-responsive protein IAA33-like [Magnolia sinica]
MNSFNSHPESFPTGPNFTPPYYKRFFGAMPTVHQSPLPRPTPYRNLLDFSSPDDALASSVVPPVTVVLEGRSICQRIHLHNHTSYQSLARALRQMFVDVNGDVGAATTTSESDLNLTNAVPGYLIAYEDMEDDLLLAGDLSWKDFVRVAKRIRILPTKANRQKACSGL